MGGAAGRRQRASPQGTQPRRESLASVHSACMPTECMPGQVAKRYAQGEQGHTRAPHFLGGPQCAPHLAAILAHRQQITLDQMGGETMARFGTRGLPF